MNVAIIGSGNVASHLIKALSGKVSLFPVNPRTLEGLPPQCDVAVISVKDDVIEEIARRISGRADIIAHTSGSKPIDVLAGCAKATGVFYPMQTFTKDVPLEYSEIPFFIEGSDSDSETVLCDLARLISPNVRLAGSDDRRKLHLAAVFACNFTNALIGVADDLLHENGMDYTVMLPLIRQTVAKLYSVPPKDAQTGPAARHDMSVINRQHDMLESKPELQSIYDSISSLILSKN